jgi:hypothetical protein
LLSVLFEPLERHPARTLAVMGGLFALLYLAALVVAPRVGGRVVNGDAIQYYAYLRSAVIDGDLDFSNDYERLYDATGDPADNVWLTSRTPIGRPTNLMSIGPAILWAPFFVITYVVLLLGLGLGATVPLDGLAAPFPLSAGVAGIVYATIGAYLCYRACRLLFPEGPAFWAAVAAWLATPAIYYSLVSPLYSHATSLFTSALFVYMWASTRGGFDVLRFVLLGALAGLCALVRWQDLVVVLFPLAELGHAALRERRGLMPAAGRAVAMGVAAVVAFLPQLLAWRAIYGEFLLLPQGGSFMQWTRPAIASVLFSLNHGLFTWTPAALVAVAGLALVIRRDALLGWTATVILLLAAYVNGSVTDWWAGEAFGARRFVGCTVIFALGFAAVFTWATTIVRPVWIRAAAVGLVVCNLLFLLQYQLFMRGFRDLVPYPATWRQVLIDRFVVPWELLARLWSG